MAITRDMLFPLAFYKKSKFNGSKGKMCYRIEKKAEEDGADYIGCGTIFKTPTKKDATTLTKQDLIDVVNAVNIPVVYIGGITEKNVKELANTGIKGVSVVSSIMESENPKISSENLKKEIEKIL